MRRGDLRLREGERDLDTERARDGDLEGDRLRERSLLGDLDLLRPGVPSVSSCRSSKCKV